MKASARCPEQDALWSAIESGGYSCGSMAAAKDKGKRKSTLAAYGPATSALIPVDTPPEPENPSDAAAAEAAGKPARRVRRETTRAHSTLPYRAVPYCAVLYCTVLYYTIPYHTIIVLLL